MPRCRKYTGKYKRALLKVADHDPITDAREYVYEMRPPIIYYRAGSIRDRLIPGLTRHIKIIVVDSLWSNWTPYMITFACTPVGRVVSYIPLTPEKLGDDVVRVLEAIGYRTYSPIEREGLVGRGDPEKFRYKEDRLCPVYRLHL